MSAFDLTTVSLLEGVEPALALVPAGPGVGQILAETDRNLVIGRSSNLRKWAASHLGQARPPRPVPGKLPPRPPTDLTPIATAIAYTKTTSQFAQRLAFERLLGRYVPLSKRRDLKPPAYLRLDPAAQLAHLLVIQPSAVGDDVYGPFRDKRAATRARDALYKHFRLRPGDFDFKPPTDVPEGVAAEVARALGGPSGVDGVPTWVRRAAGRSLIVEPGKAGVEIYPIAGGGVVEEAAVVAPLDTLEQFIDGLAWTCAAGPRDDTPWLNAWRHGKRTGVEVPVTAGEDAASIAARIRAAVGSPEAPVVG